VFKKLLAFFSRKKPVTLTSQQLEAKIDEIHERCHEELELISIPESVIDEYLVMAFENKELSELNIWRAQKYEQLFDDLNEEFFRALYDVRVDMAATEYETFWWITNYFMVCHTNWFNHLEHYFSESIVDNLSKRGLAPGSFTSQVIEE